MEAITWKCDFVFIPYTAPSYTGRYGEGLRTRGASTSGGQSRSWQKQDR